MAKSAYRPIKARKPRNRYTHAERKKSRKRKMDYKVNKARRRLDSKRYRLKNRVSIKKRAKAIKTGRVRRIPYRHK